MSDDERLKTLDDIAKANGFEDEAELISLASDVDLTRQGILFAYEEWKQYDRSKAGLLKLIEASKKKRPTP